MLIEKLRKLGDMMNRGGWIFTDAIFVAAKVRIDRHAAAAWLPNGLSLANPATATLFVAHYPRTSFGSVYSEAGLFVDVRHWGLAAAHCPWMLVDDDVALVLGREALGYPKKLGDITLSIGTTAAGTNGQPVAGDPIAASVQRRGAPLLRLEGTVDGPAPLAPPMLGRRFRNVQGTLGLSLPRLLAFTPREAIVEASSATLSLEVTGSERDPLHELGIAEVLQGYVYRVNIGGSAPPVPVGIVNPLFTVRNHAIRYL